MKFDHEPVMDSREMAPADPDTALGLSAKEHVAVIGGGGKSSLLYALAHALGRRRLRVVVGTTAKMWCREAACYPVVRFRSQLNNPFSTLEQDAAAFGRVFLAERPLTSGKVQGIPPDWANSLFALEWVDALLLEADGAAGRGLKAPAGHEPVIPASATTVVLVMGLDVLDAPLGPDTVFRAERFAALAGMAPGEPVSEDRIAAALIAPEGLLKGVAPGMRVVVLLNRLDTLTRPERALDLGYRILTARPPGVERVVLASVREQTYRIIGRRH